MNISRFLDWPHFSDEEADLVKTILKSNKVNFWTGEQCGLFESEYAESVGSHHAVAMSNGTVALEVGLRALGICEGDEVIVTPRTFIASASSIVSIGATPVFADVDINSQNITAESIVKVITNKTRAIMCVHLAGWPCEMDEIVKLAESTNIKIIEDCAQAHGASYRGQSVGAFGDVSGWSFCQDKIISTGGEGGMITTSSKEVLKKAWSYKDHGKRWRPDRDRQQGSGFHWVHDSFGTNYRMTEMQATLGRWQLNKLPEWANIRRRNAGILSSRLSTVSCLRVTNPPNYVDHAYYKYYVFIKPEVLKKDWTRDRISSEISKCGVPCYTGICPEVYLERAFDNTSWRPKKRLAVAKILGETSLMFVVHPTLEENDMHYFADVILKICSMATR